MMITIYKTKLRLRNNSIDIISRLLWKTNLEESSIFLSTRSLYANTLKPFIGNLNERKNKLYLARNRSTIKSFLPKVIVSLDTKENNTDKILYLSFSFGLYTTLFYLFLLWSTYVLTLETLKNLTLDTIISFLIWITIFVGGTLFFTILEINKTKKLIDETINID